MQMECVDVLNTLYVLRKTLSSPIVVRVKLNGKEAAMELDTGAAVSNIPESVQQQLFPQCLSTDNCTFEDVHW